MDNRKRSKDLKLLDRLTKNSTFTKKDAKATADKIDKSVANSFQKKN